MFTVTAEVSDTPEALGMNVGFGASSVPVGAMLSAVKGVNPVEEEFEWMPCLDQAGRHITCFEAVGSGGNASAPECVDMIVHIDPPPLFLNASDDGVSRSVTEHVEVTLGAAKLYTLYASDANCGDEVTISVFEELPAGAVLLPQEVCVSVWRVVLLFLVSSRCVFC